VPRDPFGLPVQRTSIPLSALPAAIANRIGWATARLALGDLTRYGMPKADFAPYTTKRIPLIDVGFVDALKRGRVTIRPALERLTPTGAVFVDGTSEPFDAIVAATGFTTGLESIIDAPGALDDLGEPRVPPPGAEHSPISDVSSLELIQMFEAPIFRDCESPPIDESERKWRREIGRDGREARVKHC
jgi:hypothetical protein